jgi:hypothetical protein
VDVLVVAAFLWAAEHTSSPPLPLLVLLLVTIVGVVVGPWAYLAARRLAGEATAGRILRRVLVGGVMLAGTGVAVAVLIATSGREGPDAAGSVAMFAILLAGLLLLVGVVVLPWLFLLTRTVARERAARVRAEERAEVATHLHDSVLQTLTLIQKRIGDPAAMARLARHAERELRGWLYGPDAGVPADLAGALRAAAAEVEDRFGVSVELVTVGACPLDERVRGVVAAAGEALTTPPSTPGWRRSRCTPRSPATSCWWPCETAGAASTRPRPGGTATAWPSRSWAGCGGWTAWPPSTPRPGRAPRWSCASRG